MSKLLAPGKAQEQGRRCRNCSKELINPEISWPPCSVSLAPRLQPGEKGRTKSRSRFNGLGAGWQTVETVRSVLAPYCTGLKPAKATVLMRGQMSPSTFELGFCHASHFIRKFKGSYHCTPFTFSIRGWGRKEGHTHYPSPGPARP